MNNFQNTTEDPELQIQTYEDGSPGAEEEVESLGSRIAHFLRACWASRKLICGIVAVGILLSVSYALFLPNVYTSTTSLMPPDGASLSANLLGTLSSGSSAADVATEALGLETPGELFASILESRNVLDGVINHLDLTHYYRTSSMEAARRSLDGDTKIGEDPKSGVITISVNAGNPVLAAKMANEFVDELNRVVTYNSTSSARRERIFLEERVKDVKQQLDESAKQLSQFSTKSGAIDVASQTRSMVDAGLKLQTELIDGRSTLAALRQNYSEDNSRVRALEAHNAELQREIDKMGGMSRGSGGSADTTGSLYPSADQLPALGLTYYDLDRKMRVDEALWEALTRQYEAAKVQEAAEIPTVHVLDVANIPEKKSAPVRRRIVEVGFALSLAFACVIVFLGMVWEGMDPEGETRRLVRDASDVVLDSRRWYWKVPGIGWIRRRLTRSEAIS